MSNIHPHVRNGGHFYFVSQNKKESEPEDRTIVPTSSTAGSAGLKSLPPPVSPYVSPLRIRQLYGRISAATSEKAHSEDNGEAEEDQNDGSAHCRSQNSNFTNLH